MIHLRSAYSLATCCTSPPDPDSATVGVLRVIDYLKAVGTLKRLGTLMLTFTGVSDGG